MSDKEPSNVSAHRFPIELVAKYAAEFLQGKMGREPLLPDLPHGQQRSPYSREVIDKAAQLAIGLLDSCLYHLNADSENKLAFLQEAQWQRSLDMASDEARAQFPNGAPWLRSLFYITDKRKEAEALPVYKDFLEHLEAYERHGKGESIEADSIQTSVQERIASLRPQDKSSQAFTVDRLAYEKAHFRFWKEHINIPFQRRTAALSRITNSEDSRKNSLDGIK